MIGREKENTEKSLTQISSAWMGIANRECQLAFLPQLTQMLTPFLLSQVSFSSRYKLSRIIIAYVQS